MVTAVFVLDLIVHLSTGANVEDGKLSLSGYLLSLILYLTVNKPLDLNRSAHNTSSDVVAASAQQVVSAGRGRHAADLRVPT